MSNLLPLRFSDYAEEYIEPDIDEVGRIRLVNLTPHIVRIILEGDDPNDSVRVDIPPAMPPATRRRMKALHEKITIDTSKGPREVPVYRNIYMDILNLPDPVEGVRYIVSQIAATGLERDDILVVEDLVRDEIGRPEACRSFAKPREALAVSQGEVDELGEQPGDDVIIDHKHSEFYSSDFKSRNRSR